MGRTDARAVGCHPPPRAVLELARLSGASHSAALRRVISYSLFRVWGALFKLEHIAYGVQTLTSAIWADSFYQGPGARYLRVYGLPLASNHRLLLEDEPDSLALELDGGPWELERPALVARVGNQRFTRVCAFLFPDEDARALALTGGG